MNLEIRTVRGTAWPLPPIHADSPDQGSIGARRWLAYQVVSDGVVVVPVSDPREDIPTIETTWGSVNTKSYDDFRLTISSRVVMLGSPENVMPYKPPASDRTFRYWISMNAVDRFRERVADPGDRALSPKELGLLLDGRIHGALLSSRYTTVVDIDNPNEDTRIVEIENREGRKFMVVMRQFRPDSYPPTRTIGGPGTPAPFAITVLDSEMAQANFANGQWRVPNRPLAAKLQGVKLSDLRHPPQPIPAPAPTPAPIPATKEPVVTNLPPPPAKPKRGASQLERIEFAKNILRERPHINYAGPDGLNQLLKNKFGTGMSLPIINELREILAKEGPQPMAPVVQKPAQPTLADQIAASINAEVKAKEALAELKSHYAKLKEEYETRISEAEQQVKAASATAERLIQSLRSS